MLSRWYDDAGSWFDDAGAMMLEAGSMMLVRVCWYTSMLGHYNNILYKKKVPKQVE